MRRLKLRFLTLVCFVVLGVSLFAQNNRNTTIGIHADSYSTLGENDYINTNGYILIWRPKTTNLLFGIGLGGFETEQFYNYDELAYFSVLGGYKIPFKKNTIQRFQTFAELNMRYFYCDEFSTLLVNPDIGADFYISDKTSIKSTLGLVYDFKFGIGVSMTIGLAFTF